jgi:starch phosphorylase
VGDLSAECQLREALGLIAAGDFSRGDPTLFAPIVRSLLDKDAFLLCADFQSYLDCQARVGQVYGKEQEWTRMSILNTARIGKFLIRPSDPRVLRAHLEGVAGESLASLTILR